MATESKMTRWSSLLLLSLAMAFDPSRGAARAKQVDAANPLPAGAKSTPTSSDFQTKAPTPNAVSEVDPTKLMQTVAANVRRNDALARNYVFQRFVDEAYSDKHGKFQHHTSKRDVVGVGGGMYERLIELDGKPIPEEERAKSERKLGHAPKQTSVYGLQYNSLTGASEQQYWDFSGVFEEFPTFFSMRILGVESVQGRPAYVIEGTRAADANPKLILEQAKAWIDAEDMIPARAQLQWPPTRTKGSVTLMDGSVEMEWLKINGEVWLPKRDFVKWHWRLPRFSLVRYGFGHGRDVYGETELISSNFRRFRVEMRIAQEASRLAPETSIFRETPAEEPSRPAEEAAIRSLVHRIVAAYQQKDSR